MDMKERTAVCRKAGMNCCQSVLCALGEYTGLPEITGVKLGYGFGGGVLCGSVCGAVTGGLMAIGCACSEGTNPAEEKPAMVDLGREFEQAFIAEFGTMMCDELTAECGRDNCEKYIEFGAECAEKFIQKQNSCAKPRSGE